MKTKTRNTLETGIWSDLKRKIGPRKGFKTEYETERLTYVIVKQYVPDIVLTRPNGKKTYIEVKGYLRPSDRVKMVAVKKTNPTLDIRFVFATDNKMSAKQKTRYSDWAKRYGFPYAIGKVPKEWLKN